MSDQRQPDERVKRYLQWYSLRLADEPEDRIRSELDERGLGEFGSSQALYTRLANDGFPVCRVCGETPVRSRHCDKPKKRQPSLGTGRRVRLPDTNAASKLFRVALEELELYISLAESE